ncbi:MAG: helix-turn-helix domain-containing protein [Bdellovibrionota bacterium]
MNNFLDLPRGDVYFNIQMHPLELSERDVAKALDKARFDPRLMEIMTEFVRDFWWRLDPTKLNKALKKSKSPFVIKGITSVIMDFSQMSKESRQEFIDWVYLCTRGIKDPNPQLLYVGVIPFGKSLFRETAEALPSFFKHNLITKDLPFNKGKPGLLKTCASLSENRLSEIELLKLKYIQKIKNIKIEKKLTNEEICQRTGINRVFLSKILNNKLDGISVEYLKKKSSLL